MGTALRCLVVVLLVPSALIWAQRSPGALPTFDQYRVTETFIGPKAPLILSPGESFRTMLRRVYSRNPNFAGHYVLGYWGCGVPCHTVAIIDARNGRIAAVLNVSDWIGRDSFPCSVDDPVEFHLNSRLLIAYGSLDDKTHGIYYFAIGARGLERLRGIEDIEEIKKHDGCHYLAQSAR